MNDTKKREKIAKEKAELLKNDLNIAGISLRKFADDFYIEKVDETANSVELDGHFERFKTTIKRNSEVTTLYSEFYKNKYSNSKLISIESMEAAYELYSQISSRVSSTPLPDNVGCDISALNSIYSLFDFWRSLHSKYGYKSCFFIKHSKPFIDNSLRYLTNKWHNKLSSIEINKDFRSDLSYLQKSTNEYIKKLEQDFKF